MVNLTAPKWARRFRQRALLVFGLCVLPGLCATAAETVQSLRYGTTLFYFFQQDYYSALTDIMVGQQLQQLGPHERRADLLRAGMSLSYGMDRYARERFEVLLEEPSYLGDRDRAWFYLAKIAWERGQTIDSLAALNNMSDIQGGEYSAQVNYLRSSIALRDGDEKGALAYADMLAIDSPWRPYLIYNFGAKQAAMGNWDAAAQYYSRFDTMIVSTEEGKQIRDKALAANGFALMASENFEEAMSQFIQVRLNSPMADRALLGYGWAASEMGNFGLALSSWQTLTDRELASPSAREGLLAIPYAYEEMGRMEPALENYRRAAHVYQTQLSSLRLAINAFREGDLAIALELGVGEAGYDVEAHGWVFGQDILPTGNNNIHIKQLLTQSSFQLVLRELQDLYRISWHLDNAVRRLKNLAEVDSDQQASWASITEGGRRDALLQNIEKLRNRMAHLQQNLQKSDAGTEGARLLAGPAQTRLWRKLDSAVETSNTLLLHGASPDQAGRLSLLSGLLIWEDSEQYPARRWNVAQDMSELQALFDTSEALLLRIDEAIARHSELEFSQRINEMDKRMGPHRLRVDRAIAQSEIQLRQIAMAHLSERELQLSRALGQSKLAIARIYDTASSEVSP